MAEKAKKPPKQTKSNKNSGKLKAVDTKLPKLTDKQRRFCEEYIIDLNATQAALRAGYCARTVNKTGPAKLVNVGIQAEIQRLKAERSERTQVKADDVVLELAKLAFSNIKNYLSMENDEVYFKDFAEITDEQAAAVESIKVMKKIIGGKGEKNYEIQAIQFKLHSKTNTLEQLGKHLGIYQKDNEQKGQTIFDILAIVGVNLDNSNNRTKTFSGKVG